MNRMMKRMERILGDCKALTGTLKDEIKEIKDFRREQEQLAMDSKAVGIMSGQATQAVLDKYEADMKEIADKFYASSHESIMRSVFNLDSGSLRPMTANELTEAHKKAEETKDFSELFADAINRLNESHFGFPNVFTHTPGMAMGEDDESLKDWQDYSKSAGQAYETDSISKSHSYDGGCNAVDETVCEAKPPISLTPFVIWIDLRRQEIIQKQAAAIENLEGFKDDWIYELQFLTKMLKKYNR